MSPDVHALVGAYLLDALDDDERTDFEAHLAQCESCADEVGSLRAATAALADPLRSEPAPELRERVLAAAAATP
ncbi:MAG: zf-HC2 domain-containing protein, partial [Nocardioides sp.]|nr:zf-HC2 domain-containing protein [Nocardioides sp.]